MNFDDFKGIQHSDGYAPPDSKLIRPVLTLNKQVLLENCGSVRLCYYSPPDVRNIPVQNVIVADSVSPGVTKSNVMWCCSPRDD